MIRFVLRFTGIWILAAGFVALVRDGTKSIAGNAMFITPFGEDWNNVHGSSLESLKAMIEGSAAWLWEPLSLYVLGAPTWLVLGILGSLLILLGRKKKPLIGYGRD